MSFQLSEKIADPGTERELQKIVSLLNVLTAERLRITYVAPSKPVDGQVALCDGVHWNPLSDGVKRPVWFDKGTNSWKSFS